MHILDSIVLVSNVVEKREPLEVGVNNGRPNL